MRWVAVLVAVAACGGEAETLAGEWTGTRSVLTECDGVVRHTSSAATARTLAVDGERVTLRDEWCPFAFAPDANGNLVVEAGVCPAPAFTPESGLLRVEDDGTLRARVVGGWAPEAAWAGCRTTIVETLARAD
jgi:hypothetical protein